MNDILFGKKEEYSFIKDWVKNNKKKYLLIYGNNGIGKTYLLKHMYPKNFINDLDSTTLFNLIIIDNLEIYDDKKIIEFMKNNKNKKIIFISNENDKTHSKNNITYFKFNDPTHIDIEKYSKYYYNKTVKNISDFRKIKFMIYGLNNDITIKDDSTIAKNILFFNIYDYIRSDKKKKILNIIQNNYINILTDLKSFDNISKIMSNIRLYKIYDFDFLRYLFKNINYQYDFTNDSSELYFSKIKNLCYKKENLSIDDVIYIDKILKNNNINKLRI